jgi:hypothetical protein
VNAAKAYQAMLALASSPARSVALVRKHLQPAVAPDAERLQKLIADLDSEKFAARNQATKELKALGDLASPALRKSLEGDTSPETRRRIEELLEKLKSVELTGDPLRAARAVALLECISTSDARRHLESLAAGMPETRLTRAATAALERLNRRSKSIE